MNKLPTLKSVALWLFVLLVLCPVFAEAKTQGGLVLSFDNGYPDWITNIAPELAKVGGVATGFPVLKNIRSGRLSFEDLRTLQDRYGWEIGAKTDHNYDAQDFAKRKGLSAWVSQELVPPLQTFRGRGLVVHDFTFPFNSSNPELRAAVMRYLESYRRQELLALGSGRRADGSIPGTELSLANWVPLELIKKWIDLAHETNQLLFLYGHLVLPDTDFVSGTVESVSERTITAAQDVKLPKLGPLVLPGEGELYLVPNTSVRFKDEPIKILKVEGRQIQVGRGDLTRYTQPGATFMIGPGYGTPLSYFHALVDYAAKHLKFLTVHQAVSGQWRKD